MKTTTPALDQAAGTYSPEAITELAELKRQVQHLTDILRNTAEVLRETMGASDTADHILKSISLPE